MLIHPAIFLRQCHSASWPGRSVVATGPRVHGLVLIVSPILPSALGGRPCRPHSTKLLVCFVVERVAGYEGHIRYVFYVPTAVCEIERLRVFKKYLRISRSAWRRKTNQTRNIFNSHLLLFNSHSFIKVISRSFIDFIRSITIFRAIITYPKMQHFIALALFLSLVLGKPVTIVEKSVFPRNGNGNRTSLYSDETIRACEQAPNCELHKNPAGLFTIGFVKGEEPGTANYAARFNRSASSLGPVPSPKPVGLVRRAETRTNIQRGRNTMNYGDARPEEVLDALNEICGQISCDTGSASAKVATKVA